MNELSSISAVYSSRQNSVINSQNSIKSNSDEAATQFTAIFIEKMLNSSRSEIDPITGGKRDLSNITLMEMNNHNLALKISEHSPIKDTIKKIIESKQNATR